MEDLSLPREGETARGKPLLAPRSRPWVVVGGDRRDLDAVYSPRLRPAESWSPMPPSATFSFALLLHWRLVLPWFAVQVFIWLSTFPVEPDWGHHPEDGIGLQTSAGRGRGEYTAKRSGRSPSTPTTGDFEELVGIFFLAVLPTRGGLRSSTSPHIHTHRRWGSIGGRGVATNRGSRGGNRIPITRGSSRGI